MIADNTWAAFQGRKLLKVSGRPVPTPKRQHRSRSTRRRASWSKTPGRRAQATGDVDAALTPAKSIDGDLRNAVSRARDDGADERHRRRARRRRDALVRPRRRRRDAQETRGEDHRRAAREQSGRTRRSSAAASAGAARPISSKTRSTVSKAAGMPIKVVWTREDDIRNDPISAAAPSNALRRPLAPDGKIVALKHTMAASSIVHRALPFLMKERPGSELAGNGMANHRRTRLPNQLVDWHRARPFRRCRSASGARRTPTRTRSRPNRSSTNSRTRPARIRWRSGWRCSTRRANAAPTCSNASRRSQSGGAARRPATPTAWRSAVGTTRGSRWSPRSRCRTAS